MQDLHCAVLGRYRSYGAGFFFHIALFVYDLTFTNSLTNILHVWKIRCRGIPSLTHTRRQTGGTFRAA